MIQESSRSFFVRKRVRLGQVVGAVVYSQQATEQVYGKCWLEQMDAESGKVHRTEVCTTPATPMRTNQPGLAVWTSANIAPGSPQVRLASPRLGSGTGLGLGLGLGSGLGLFLQHPRVNYGHPKSFQFLERPRGDTFVFLVDRPHLATLVVEVWSRGNEAVRAWVRVRV